MCHWKKKQKNSHRHTPRPCPRQVSYTLRSLGFMRVWPGLDPPFTWSETKRNKNRYTDTHTESQLSHSQSCRQPRHSYIYQGDLIVASQSFILWYSIPLSRCLCLVLVLSFLTHTDTHTRQRLRSRTRTKMELKTRRSFYFLKKECCFDSLNSCVMKIMILSVDMVIIFSAINTQPQTAVTKRGKTVCCYIG